MKEKRDDLTASLTKPLLTCREAKEEIKALKKSLVMYAFTRQQARVDLTELDSQPALFVRSIANLYVNNLAGEDAIDVMQHLAHAVRFQPDFAPVFLLVCVDVALQFKDENNVRPAMKMLMSIVDMAKSLDQGDIDSKTGEPRNAGQDDISPIEQAFALVIFALDSIDNVKFHAFNVGLPGRIDSALKSLVEQAATVTPEAARRGAGLISRIGKVIGKSGAPTTSEVIKAFTRDQLEKLAPALLHVDNGPPVLPGKPTMLPVSRRHGSRSGRLTLCVTIDKAPSDSENFLKLFRKLLAHQTDGIVVTSDGPRIVITALNKPTLDNFRDEMTRAAIAVGIGADSIIVKDVEALERDAKSSDITGR